MTMLVVWCIKNKFKKQSMFTKVLFINPRFEDAMFNISYTYAQVQDFDKAIEWVQNQIITG